MLTRIEIDGFKTFEEFSMDLAPLVVILGPNASGKSNLFDAIRLLSHLAGSDLRTAVRGLRGEPHELFRRQADGVPGNRMRFSLEVLLDNKVCDPWGSEVEIAHTRLRYEVVIERRKDDRGIERLVVAKEEAKPILSKKDHWRPYGREVSKRFRHAFMKYSGRTSPFLITENANGVSSFRICQDGHPGRKRSAEAAEATVLSSITSAEFPHLYALREELRSWRFLQLDPMTLRRPSPTTAAEELEPDGSNLPTVLARIQAETRTDDSPRGALAEIAIDLTDLIPGVVDLKVEEDKQNREYRVDVSMRGGPPFSSRVVSDGTLRILALLTFLHDPKRRGLVCFEEPENGIHPARLSAMIGRLRDLVSNPTEEEISEGLPLSQILMNSHSPVVLSSLGEGAAVMFADMVDIVNPKNGSIERKTRIRPVRPKDQGVLWLDDNREYVSSFEVAKYLSTVNRGD